VTKYFLSITQWPNNSDSLSHSRDFSFVSFAMKLFLWEKKVKQRIFYAWPSQFHGYYRSFFFEKYGWEWDWLWIFPRYICLHQKKVNQCVHAGCIGDDVEQALVIDAVGFGNILIKVKNCWVLKMLLIGFEDIVSYQRKSYGFGIIQAWGWKLVEFGTSQICRKLVDLEDCDAVKLPQSETSSEKPPANAT
jgi:hypothetical protein